MIHELKTVQPFFDEVWFKRKRFEVRKNDRNYQVGDKVCLEEYDAEKNEYGDRKIIIKIDYILDDQQYVREGFVIFCWSEEETLRLNVLKSSNRR